MLRLHQELQPHLGTYMYIPPQDLCWIHDSCNEMDLHFTEYTLKAYKKVERLK